MNKLSLVFSLVLLILGADMGFAQTHATTCAGLGAENTLTIGGPSGSGNLTTNNADGPAAGCAGSPRRIGYYRFTSGPTLQHTSISASAATGNLVLQVYEGCGSSIELACANADNTNGSAQTESLNFLASPNTTYIIKVINAQTANSNMNITSISVFLPLPIELVEFSCVNTGTHNLLKWTTASERDNDFFTLERSANGVDFDTFVIVPGAGNTSTELTYVQHDYSPFFPLTYYRLSQTDYDGTTKSFAPILVKVSEPAIIVGLFNLSGQQVDESAKGLVFVHYSDGRIVKRFME
jgi:hypothetical protein